MIARQMEVRSNIKKYFDMAYEGEVVIIPRKQDKNVVIISEAEYNRLRQGSLVNAYSRAYIAKEDKARPVREYNDKKLESIRSLKDNWNGNGAPAFPGTLLDKVEVLLERLRIQPEIFPTALCTIQLEYDNSRRDHMEIEISEGNIAEIFIVRFNGEEIAETIPVDADAINTRVEEFYG
jgi:antitoxin YefM